MRVTAIFPHQLFDPHPALARADAVYLFEDSLFFGDPLYPARFHTQKLIFHRASMRAYAARLSKQGFTVHYVEYDPEQTAADHIRNVAGTGVDAMAWVEPVDDMLSRRVKRACRECGITLDTYETPQFLTPMDWGRQAIGPRRPYRMATFYMAQRRRLNLLMDGNEPVGGAWSFDADNRKKWPKRRQPPAQPQVTENEWTREARRYVEQRFPDNPGAAASFVYPVTHADAETWLTTFLHERLIGFGTYEDAMVRDAPVLHHSVLTPLLNSGLLTPEVVVDSVIAYADEVAVPLNDLEGFIRQIIGWREFMMLMYRIIGVEQRTTNFWEHQRPMPDSFYTGTTGIEPVDHVIRRLLDTAYSHHIERLMLLGNLMLLCEIDPDHVYRWFMELYIDAYDWVMVPNVYGMSQFADGGLVCTKPYISGSNYVRKMSDYSAGPWCTIWDGLFWRFIHQHRAFFVRNPRLSMMARSWDRMDADKQRQHLKVANDFLEQCT